MIPCRDCSERYIAVVDQTSKKIATRTTEHKNAMKRHDLKSLPATHSYDNCHTFNWAITQLLGRAPTKYAREFKEAWHSTDDTINRHIDIPIQSTYNLRLYVKTLLQQFRVIRDHLNSKCLTSIIVFDIQVRSSIQ